MTQTAAAKMTPDSRYLPDWLSIILLAAAVVLITNSFRFGFIAVLVFYITWLTIAVIRRHDVIKNPKGPLLLLALPLYSCYSFFWSDYPWLSLYSGLQFLALTICFITIARTVTLIALIKGIALGSFLVLSASLISGQYTTDFLTGEAVFIGLFTSKNQVGLYATLCILSSGLLLFRESSLRQKFITSIIPLVVSFIALVQCRSATSLLSLSAVMALLLSAYALTRFPQKARALMLTMGIFAAITGAVVLQSASISVSGATLNSVGKDTTLTGRTTLWNEGINIGAERPILGHGFTAFWVQGQPQAERFWDEFKIPSRMGFHFHNTYVQAFVDLGIIGVLMIAAIICTGFLRSLKAVVNNGLTVEYTFLLATTGMFLVRSFVEVDFFGHFGTATLLVFGAPLMLTKHMSVTSKT